MDTGELITIKYIERMAEKAGLKGGYLTYVEFGERPVRRELPMAPIREPRIDIDAIKRKLREALS